MKKEDIPIEERVTELQSLIFNFCKDNPDLIIEYVSMSPKEFMITYRDKDKKQKDVVLSNKNLS